jgi:DNA repair protein RecO (recombination protein O)
MPRNFTYSALALRVRSSGESNREAWFLTGEEGLLKATVFGGPKSRLRSQVASFNEGKLFIYHDPVRDSRKVSDFDVQSWRPGIRELWERAMAADAVAETILASQGGGGNWQTALKLSGEVLDALSEANACACSVIAVYFLWHWAQILGVRPEISVCASCGREGTLWYSTRKEALLCEKCKPNTDTAIRLAPSGLLWLKGIEPLSPLALERVSQDKWAVDAASLEQVKALAMAVLASALGKRLPTWDGV